MSFSLKTDGSLRRGIKRVVCQQIDQALDVLGSNDQDEAVHTARKCFKKARAVIRLVRDELGDETYRRENAAFRDAGRPLTSIRDAYILIEAFDKLRERLSERARASVSVVRDVLEANRQAIRKRVIESEHAFDRVSCDMRQSRKRVSNWAIDPRGWDSLHAGLMRMYKKNRRAHSVAKVDPSVRNLHEWRKQAKYLRYELQLLARGLPCAMHGLPDRFDELTKLLGEDHDFAVLREIIEADPIVASKDRAVAPLVDTLDQRRRELEQQAFDRAEQLYVETPKRFTRWIRPRGLALQG